VGLRKSNRNIKNFKNASSLQVIQQGRIGRIASGWSGVVNPPHFFGKYVGELKC
jgi:hypothetical protein